MNTFGILYPTEIESGESEVHRRAKSKLGETQNELRSPLLLHASHYEWPSDASATLCQLNATYQNQF